MTMIDEEALRAALQGAADSIAVPDRAVDQILVVAQRLDARPRAARRFRRRPDDGVDVTGAAKQFENEMCIRDSQSAGARRARDREGRNPHALG